MNDWDPDQDNLHQNKTQKGFGVKKFADNQKTCHCTGIVSSDKSTILLETIYDHSNLSCTFQTCSETKN